MHREEIPLGCVMLDIIVKPALQILELPHVLKAHSDL